METIKNRPLRIFTYFVGWLFILLALVGLFLPVMPTVPFLLAATWCFVRSSPKTHLWLLHNPWFGPPLRDWEERGAIKPRSKMIAVSFIAGSLLMMWIKVPMLTLKIAITAVLVTASVFIVTRPNS